MRVFVTGATGFVGAHLLRRLLRAGHQVSALARDVRRLPPAVTPVPGDLNDVPGFAAALAGQEAIVHSAALKDPLSDPHLAQRINIDATVRLAEAAARAGATQFVFVSSIMALGIRPLGR